MTNIKVLSSSDVQNVLKIDEVINIVEKVYKKKTEGQAETWPTVFYDFESGNADMDIKSGYIKGTEIFGSKTVSWFGDNEAKGLPTLNGVIVVFDGKTGIPEGVVEGAYITGMRTGAAGAIGAKLLARQESENLMILGAGNQAVFQIGATLTLLPNIKTVRIVDIVSPDNAKMFVASIADRLLSQFAIDASKVKFEAVNEVKKAVSLSDIIITVTPSHSPVIRKEWVKPGTHFSCIGADMVGKEEIDPELFSGARIFTDDKKQCIQVGETEIPVKKGIISESDIAGEIGDILAGKIAGRTDDNQITIFDATGMAMLDLATAKLALESAKENCLGTDAQL
jgi:ornithine cyclodeaminase/alanine dehydrogenase